jgi:hypothetical protein
MQNKASSKSITGVTSIIMVVVVMLVVFNNTRSRKARERKAVEAAIKDFPFPHDSSYAEDDTVRFYKNDSFVGKSVIVTE